MSDLIERQAAIEALYGIECHEWDDVPGKYFEWDDVEQCLNGLPSAQPEREHTMEEFMYGQDSGSPEDGSL